MSGQPIKITGMYDKIRGHVEWPKDTKAMDSKSIERGFFRKLRYNMAKDPFTFTNHDLFLSLSYTIRDRVIERWIATQQQYYDNDVKRVYYLSLEFLLGRLLDNNVINLGIKDTVVEAINDLGFNYEDLEDEEVDAGLGNGGLGRLAACFRIQWQPWSCLLRAMVFDTILAYLPRR
jgi:starch phosphorylase